MQTEALDLQIVNSPTPTASSCLIKHWLDFSHIFYPNSTRCKRHITASESNIDEHIESINNLRTYYEHDKSVCHPYFRLSRDLAAFQGQVLAAVVGIFLLAILDLTMS